jgi:putative cardiolipin synthase
VGELPHVLRLRTALGALAVLVLIAGCAPGLPRVSPELKPFSTALAPDTDTHFGRTTMPLAGAHPGRSGFYVLRNDIEALAARLLLAERAERSIDVQYYLLHADLTGYVFVEQLLKAADRGVRVRILLDDITTEGHDPGLVALDSHPNIEVRIFNPFSRSVPRLWNFVVDFDRVNHRMHNKSMTFDNQATIVGGRNIGDEYFDARADMNYNDLELFAVGPVVQEVSAEFDTYWNSAAVVPVQALLGPAEPQALERLRVTLKARADEARQTTYRTAFSSSLSELFGFRAEDVQWAPWRVVYDPPEKALAGFDRHLDQVNAQFRPIVDSA